MLTYSFPLAQDRIPGEPFVPKSAKEAEMEKIMKSMQVSILFNCSLNRVLSLFCVNFGIITYSTHVQGMPGAPSMKMYSREDLTNMQNFGDADPDEDSDDDESHFPSKLVLHELPFGLWF